jgi:WD40 repeat protein
MRVGTVVTAAVMGLVALTACDHARPFQLGRGEPGGPFDGTFPRRLTFRAGPNVDASWSPDGALIAYAFQLPQPDHDQCLGVLPSQGGHLVQIVCHVPRVLDADSTNVLSNPALGPRSAIAYLRESSAVGAESPHTRDLVVGAMAQPESGRVAISFPYLAPDGVLHTSLSNLHWLSSTTLVYLAELVTYFTRGTLVDTIVTPLEVAVADVSGATTVIRIVPGTAGATSVSTTPGDSESVYVTMAHDSVVYAVNVASGVRTPQYDFDSLGTCVGAQVASGRLVAILGAMTDSLGAGQVYAARLPSGGLSQLTSGPYVFYERPALSPSGTQVVAEGHAVQYLRVEGGPVDTVVSAASDLWLLEVP